MRDKKASITVEAALVLPLFTVTVLAVCFVFRLMLLEISVQSAISKAASDISSYGYLLNKAEAAVSEKKDELLSNVPLGDTILSILTDFAEDYALKLIVSNYLDDVLLEECRVKGGYGGLVFTGSKLRDEDNCVYIRVSYKVDIPFVGRLLPDIIVNQQAGAGIFSGEIPLHVKPPQETQDSHIVYVTKNAAVYHTSLLCTHLKLDISPVSKEELPSKRNPSGHKYYACDFCVNKRAKMPDTVYIGRDGDRYHYRENCIALRRHVEEVELSSIDLPMCSRCRQREENEQEKED
ncbi:MAG: pilus assembly protein [Lachnospiraceae bacterium]|nr:pilus assembly protein [Lachnospiraceae bacterium]